MKIIVSDLLDGKKHTSTMPQGVKNTFKHVTDDYFVEKIHGEEDLQMTILDTHEYEDNFIRHVYRLIEVSVNKLHP